MKTKAKIKNDTAEAKVCQSLPGNLQKLGESCGNNPPSLPSGRTSSADILDLGHLGSRTVGQ